MSKAETSAQSSFRETSASRAGGFMRSNAGARYDAMTEEAAEAKQSSRTRNYASMTACQGLIVQDWSNPSASFQRLAVFLEQNGFAAVRLRLADHISLDDDVKVKTPRSGWLFDRTEQPIL